MLDRDGVATVIAADLARFRANSPRAPRDWVLRVTSGTSGRQPILIASNVASYTTAFAPWFRWERTLICFGTSALRVFHTIAAERMAPGASQTLAMDVRDLHPRLAGIVREFEPTCIRGFPSFIVRASDFFDAGSAKKVRAILCAGEPVTADVAGIFSRKFPNAVLHSVYITNETGPLSKETCGFLPHTFFHPLEGVVVEINATDERGVGDVVVTTRAYGTIPLEKYQTGDLGRFHEQRCGCGEPITFEIVGRAGYDHIKLLGALLTRAEFDRVTGLFANIIDDYRVEAREDSSAGALKGAIALSIYSKHGVGSDALCEEIRARISRELFLTANETLEALVRRGLFMPLQIVWVEAPFTDGHKPIKLRRV